ncbi:hypothetical protein [Pyrobaculum aerophilum]|uniref:hypothetical protein n=1 Tax=Pyrobaculum aerophilum TaxID=13773 RepID=UPI002161FF6A|nr:hypothetical protein [Pyrobaculum aerophilum]
MRKFPPQCGVLCRLSIVLADIFASAQGNAVTLHPGEVAKEAQIPPFIVGEIFRVLSQKGYMECWRLSHKKLKCTVRRASPLWTSDKEAILALLQQL